MAPETELLSSQKHLEYWRKEAKNAWRGDARRTLLVLLRTYYIPNHGERCYGTAAKMMASILTPRQEDGDSEEQHLFTGGRHSVL